MTEEQPLETQTLTPRQAKKLAKLEKKEARKAKRRARIKNGLKKTEKGFELKTFDTIANHKPSHIRDRAKADAERLKNEETEYEHPEINNNIYLLALLSIVLLVLFSLGSALL